MISISLCMIVKDEEDVICRCLDSVEYLVDEINIVDTGSKDRTKEILAQYTDRIFDFTWIDDFSAARNFVFKQATQDFILWLDADDILLKHDQDQFKKLKKTLRKGTDVVSMNYNIAFDEFGNVSFWTRRNRLVKREKHFQWFGAVHEYLSVGGNVYQSDISITHHPLKRDLNRNLRIYEKRLANSEHFTPRDLYYFANELTDHIQYERAIRVYEEFLSTGKGWIEDNISACGKLADCHLQLGQSEQALQSIYRSFSFDRPRPEFCCRLGYYFLQQDKIQIAIFWYELSTQTSPDEKSKGFVNESCSTWLPHIQLCVCHDRLGDYQNAYRHNEIARAYRPEDKNILHNKQYLESRV